MNTRQFVLHNPTPTLHERRPGPMLGSQHTLGNIVSESDFLHMLDFERKRTERTGRPLMLVLAQTGDASAWDGNLKGVIEALEASKRETDLIGWYHEGFTIGVIFNELNGAEGQFEATIRSRITQALWVRIGEHTARAVELYFHLFPERKALPDGIDLTFYPDVIRRRRFAATVLKRCTDVVFTAVLITLLAPIFLIIAAAVKLTSSGPVFFKQSRIGQYGMPFTFLKFRSMHVNCDSKMHEQYVATLIQGNGSSHNDNGKAVFKIVNDSRVTPVGRFIRKTSMDELPQLFNVLRGDMSLVGPRPPVPYEFDKYSSWHRRRVIEAKPGITGLWQVNGRSKLTFNEMVRLDLAYVQQSSVWLDFKILLKTPVVVLSGDGAY